MHFHIITIFPDMLTPFVEEGVIGRAKNLKETINISFYNPRDFTTDTHRTTDERPFGGGPGMVLKALPVLLAVEEAQKKIKDQRLKKKDKGKNTKVKIVILSPRGEMFTSNVARDLAEGYTDIILICGRYEGIDARVKEILSATEISIGEYVLSGGELGAGIIVDAVSRFLPGVLGNEESLEEARVSTGEMYTRPETLVWEKKEYGVPDVLLSGHHAKIEEWRKEKG